jgi:hypothetical protein
MNNCICNTKIHCKGLCRYCYNRAYRQHNQIKIKAHYKKWREDNKDYTKKHNSSPKHRFCFLVGAARKRKILCDLTEAQYIRLINDNCYYCDKSLIEATGISLDRVDNGKGYEIGNVLPCCGDCNYIRGDILTVDETKIVIKALLAYRESKCLDL